MRYLPIKKELFIENRKNFFSHLKKNAIALFNSNDLFPTGADSFLPFKQNLDFFYLSNIDQQESILLLFKDKEHTKEMLFITAPNEHTGRWEGETLSKEKAYELSGIKDVFWIEEFKEIFHQLVHKAKHIYLNINEHYRSSPPKVETREKRFIKKIIKQYPLHNLKRSNPILQHLRSIKKPHEIDLLNQACLITEKGFRRVLNFIKPGKWEYEIEAEWIHEFTSHRAHFAYSPIIASGKNACILHYTQNNNKCQKEDLLLMDVGACYAHYNADLSRCIPVNGRFSQRAKQLYKVLLEIKKQTESLLIAEKNMATYQKEVGEISTEAFKKINLIDPSSKDPNAYKRYFMHGISHHLGLDTHDYGILSEPFKENMVFSIEPGIYIPEENIGIRLEDNYVVQKQGPPINLMKNIPIEIEEIEDLMHA